MARTNRSRRKRCKAKARRSGEQCKRYACDGFDVCPSHGVGTKKRVATGERKDPTRTQYQHGLYADTARDIGVRVSRYMDRPGEEILSIKLMAARLWVALEQVDQVADPNPEHVARLVAQLARLVHTNHTIQMSGETISRGQVVGLLVAILGWVQELSADPLVRRAEIPLRLEKRLRALATQVGSGPVGDGDARR